MGTWYSMVYQRFLNCDPRTPGVRVAITGGPKNYKKWLQTVQEDHEKTRSAEAYDIIEREMNSQERCKMPIGLG